MNITLPISDSIHRIFEPTSGGAVELVDRLLGLCPKDGLQLDWLADHCHVRVSHGGTAELLELPIRRSVIRAMLARVAALCNEYRSHSMSPYGGQGELLFGLNPPVLFKATITNTPDEQKLVLSKVAIPPNGQA